MTQPTIHDPICCNNACALVSAIILSELEDHAVKKKEEEGCAGSATNESHYHDSSGCKASFHCVLYRSTTILYSQQSNLPRTSTPKPVPCCYVE